MNIENEQTETIAPLKTLEFIRTLEMLVVESVYMFPGKINLVILSVKDHSGIFF